MRRKARKIVVDGVKFDSGAEASRYHTLLLQQRQGIITDLKRQVTYHLVDGVKLSFRPRKQPPIRYTCDAQYVVVKTGVLVVEDVKPFKNGVPLLTASFVLKAHLMKAVHGIDIICVP